MWEQLKGGESGTGQAVTQEVPVKGAETEERTGCTQTPPKKKEKDRNVNLR